MYVYNLQLRCPFVETKAIVGQSHHHEVSQKQTPLHTCWCSPGAIGLVFLSAVIPEFNQVPCIARRCAKQPEVQSRVTKSVILTFIYPVLVISVFLPLPSQQLARGHAMHRWNMLELSSHSSSPNLNRAVPCSDTGSSTTWERETAGNEAAGVFLLRLWGVRGASMIKHLKGEGK